MSGLVPGKLTRETITGKVPIFEPGDNDRRRKVAELTATAKKLPRTEFQQLLENVQDDRALARELLVDLSPLYNEDGEERAFTPDVIDEIYEVDWQFNPIIDFCLSVNNDRVREALRRKN